MIITSSEVKQRLSESELLIKYAAEIEELREDNADMRGVNQELRARVHELDRSNLELAQENKRLRERLRSYAESTEKCPGMRMKHTEEND